MRQARPAAPGSRIRPGRHDAFQHRWQKQGGVVCRDIGKSGRILSHNPVRAIRLPFKRLAGDPSRIQTLAIKGIFAERDCKLSRMTQICAALDLTLDDLAAETTRVDLRPASLGDRQEAQLADDRPAFHLFLLLLDGRTVATILNQYQMAPAKVFDLGLRLEKIELANLARRDQLTQPDAALQSYKAGIAIAPIAFSELQSLDKPAS